jgi:dihydrolipoamide dehydrogenase
VQNTMDDLKINVLVIGAGPGGYVAAIRAAQQGLSVIVADDHLPGGVCLHSGCIPSKALISSAHLYESMLSSKHKNMGIVAHNVSIDMAQIQQWKEGIVQKLTKGIIHLLKKNQVSFIKGKVKLTGSYEAIILEGSKERRIQFQSCIIATGSRPMEHPEFPYGERILSSKEALTLDHIPSSLIIVGGGYIGVELGQMYTKFGTKVTIVEYSTRILPSLDQELTAVLERKLEKEGIELLTGAKAKCFAQTDDMITVTCEIGMEEKEVSGEYAIIAIGRKPNTELIGHGEAGVTVDNKGFIEVDKQCRTSANHIYAIGDIVKGPALAHKASYEGKIAAEVIAGLTSAVDYKAIPAVVFSDPEIATIGLTELEAKDLEYAVTVGRFSYGSNGRALLLDGSNGFVKIVAEKQTGLVIGAQIIGLEASNLIAELGLAIEMGSTMEDIASTIHAHPTLGEIVMEACEEGIKNTTGGVRNE